jgi:hypothetical protein
MTDGKLVIHPPGVPSTICFDSPRMVTTSWMHDNMQYSHTEQVDEETWALLTASGPPKIFYFKGPRDDR